MKNNMEETWKKFTSNKHPIGCAEFISFSFEGAIGDLGCFAIMHVYNEHLIERSIWLGWSRVNHVLSSHSSTNKQQIQHLYVIQKTF